jgi:diguanylate cyclase (GGDEF)-like protein
MELQVEEALYSTLKSYGDALVAVGEAGAQACPPVGEELKESLLNLRLRLSAETSADAITETEQLLEKELQTWGARAANFYEEKTDEVKEILTIVAQAASQVGERDQRYAKQFGDLTDRLQATARLTDLSTIRQALVKNVVEFKTCVTKMAKDGEQSVAELRARMTVYESRLEEAERIACQDGLTGLVNRRKLECQLEARVKKGRPFCVLYVDLNGLKQVNDSFGHLAGDDLLKQFAGELRMAFRTTDVVARWGGDEFVVLADGDFLEGKTRVERIEKWVTGEFSVTTESGPRKVHVSAAAGVASWQPNDTPTTILRRADAAMYEDKARLKSGSKSPAR